MTVLSTAFCLADHVVMLNYEQRAAEHFHVLLTDDRERIAIAHMLAVARPQGRGNIVVRLLASHQGELDSISVGVTSLFPHVSIVLDDSTGQRVFSGLFRFPRPCIPALLHTHLASPSDLDVKSRRNLSTPLHTQIYLIILVKLVGTRDPGLVVRRGGDSGSGVTMARGALRDGQRELGRHDSLPSPQLHFLGTARLPGEAVSSHSKPQGQGRRGRRIDHGETVFFPEPPQGILVIEGKRFHFSTPASAPNEVAGHSSISSLPYSSNPPMFGFSLLESQVSTICVLDVAGGREGGMCSRLACKRNQWLTESGTGFEVAMTCSKYPTPTLPGWNLENHGIPASGRPTASIVSYHCATMRRRAAREVTCGREICDCEYQAVKCTAGRLDYWTRCTSSISETAQFVNCSSRAQCAVTRQIVPQGINSVETRDHHVPLMREVNASCAGVGVRQTSNSPSEVEQTCGLICTAIPELGRFSSAKGFHLRSITFSAATNEWPRASKARSFRKRTSCNR
ncbi:hypothetical protein PR048_021044 [Dryococelus australis]|uniref:Uncharacterized protein n=1 Tax=Dryococelus australis TaxID=614101 RepID=A0ABQ9GX70_9NEOP|nr:hypothetical protein PR048_021044 [Dryococelus australis]